MTVTVAPRYKRFNGNDTTGPFSFTFPILLSNSGTPYITVKRISSSGEETTLAYPTDYTFSALLLGKGGGIITTTVMVATGEQLFVEAATPLDQQISFRNQGEFSAESHENGFDKVHFILIESVQKDDLSIKFPSSEIGVGTTLPVAALRANTTLGFDDDGDLVCQSISGSPVSTAMQPVVNAPTTSEALTLIGALPDTTTAADLGALPDTTTAADLGALPDDGVVSQNGAIMSHDFLLLATAATGLQCVFYGDSLTNNALGTNPPSYYVTMPTWNGRGFTKNTSGNPGRTALWLAQSAWQYLNPYYATFEDMNIVFFHAGINDIALGATAAEAYARYAAACAHFRSLGWKVVATTLFSANGYETQRNAFNAYVKANWQTFADGLTDLAANATLGPDGSCSNLTYFQADGVHLTNAGNALVGADMQAAVTNMLACYKAFSVGAAPLPSVGSYFFNDAMVGSSQYGGFFAPTFGSDATALAGGLAILTRTKAASFTLPNLYNVYVADCIKGAGSTVTTQYGVYIPQLSAGSTNWAFYAAGTTPSYFGGVVTPASGIKGTTTNDSATAGNVGEFIQSRVTTNTNFPAATTVVGDATSITLTAGDWDLDAILYAVANGATVAGVSVGIGTTAGNSVAGCQIGDNYAQFLPPTSATGTTAVIPSYRVSIASTTTFYLKLFGTYTVATPQYQCRLSARRVR